MYLAYTYLITNKNTHQFYYGFRCKNVKLKRQPEDDFWIYYFTSSKRVKKLITEHGKDSFNFQILSKDEDYDKCYFYEQELISEHIDNPLCLNGHCNKTGKWSIAGTTHIISDQTKDKISIAMKGRPAKNKGRQLSEETRQKMRDATRPPVSEDHKAKIGAAHKGMTRSEETKAKMRVAALNRKSTK